MNRQLAIGSWRMAMDYRLAISDFATGLQLTGSQIKFGMTGEKAL